MSGDSADDTSPAACHGGARRRTHHLGSGGPASLLRIRQVASLHSRRGGARRGPAAMWGWTRMVSVPPPSLSLPRSSRGPGRTACSSGTGRSSPPRHSSWTMSTPPCRWAPRFPASALSRSHVTGSRVVAVLVHSARASAVRAPTSIDVECWPVGRSPGQTHLDRGVEQVAIPAAGRNAAARVTVPLACADP